MKNFSGNTSLSAFYVNDSKTTLMELYLQNTEHFFLLLDTGLRVILTNDITVVAMRTYLGHELTEGMSVFDLAPPERHPELALVYQKVLQGQLQLTETQVPQAGGERVFQNRFLPARNATGDITGVIVTSYDITDKRKYESSYRFLFRGHPIAMWIYDPVTLQILEANESAAALYGYSLDEFHGLSVVQLRPEEDIPAFLEIVRSIKAEEKQLNFSFRHRKKNGEIFYVEVVGSSVEYKGRGCRLVSVVDLTDRVRTELELKRSNERFRLAAQASSEALWEWDFQTNTAYISEAYKDMLGWETNDFRKFDRWEDYIHPADQAATIESYNTALNDRFTEKWQCKYRYRKADNSYAYVHDKAYFVRDEKGRPLKVIGALMDITQVEEAGQELQKSNERFQLASRAASDAIYEWDVVSNEIYWGEGLQALFGHLPGQLTMDAWEGLIHPADRNKTIRSLQDALKHPRKKIWKQEYRFCKDNGRYSHVLERGFIVRDAEGNALRMIGSMQDISERKQQEQLLAVERQIFELSANPDRDLGEIVTPMLVWLEEQHPEVYTSLLRCHDSGLMECLSAPRLPQDFIDAINGICLGPEEGCCGRAGNSCDPAVSPDVESDPLWTDFSGLAAQHGLVACWSLPITNGAGKTVGSFAIYYREKQSPTATLIALVDRIRNLVRIVIENRLAIQELKASNERFDTMMKATHDLVWDWNLQTNQIYRDPTGLQKVYGIANGAGLGSFQDWLERVHPEDHERVVFSISDIIRSVDKDHFETEYRFRRDDGSYTFVYDRGMLLRDEAGKPLRMIGAAQDISLRKRLERELLQNELEHQKAINQATVETQEQERTEIGKELHDNVNQVLTTTKLYLDLAMSNPELKDELIQKSSRNIINVINEIRQLSRSLMDPSIGDLGLIDSIRDLIDNINLTRKLHVSLQAEPKIEKLLDKSHKLTLFRIIQEALNNAIRHAKATSVVIRLGRAPGEVQMTIEDDGIGFNLKTVKKGAGLKNIENRIYLINGTHGIESTPNKGSKLTLKFPVQQSTTEHTN